MHRLLHESLRLVRNHTCQPIKPLKVFGLSEIQQALRFFAAHDRLGKIVIDVAGTNQASPIEVSLLVAIALIF